MRKIKGLSIMERLGRIFRCTITPTPPPHCYGSKPGAQARAENCCDDCPHDRTCNPAVPLHAQYAGYPSESAKKFYEALDGKSAVPLHSHRLGESIIYIHVDENDPYRWIKQYRDVLFIDHPHIIDMLAAGYAPQECKQWQLENDAIAVPLHNQPGVTQ